MSDERLRALRRARDSDPTDELAAKRLRLEEKRMGLWGPPALTGIDHFLELVRFINEQLVRCHRPSGG